jgi:sn-glycerol 3-phosphate transport system substrate-binding protein
MMKRVLSVIVTVVLSAALLTAGGSKDTAATTKKTDGGRIEITFWHIFGDAKRQGWIQGVVKSFNESQNTYTVVEENKGSYRDCIQAAILAAKQGTAPSLVHIAEAGSQLAYDTGIFTPVGEIGSFDTSDYIQPVLNYYTINGKVNSIPFNSSSPVLYINATMLEKAGLPADYVPATFSDMINACLKARKAGVPDANISVSLNGWFFEQWLSEQNACMFNNGNGRTSRATETLLTSPAAMKIAQFYAAMRDNKVYTYTGKFEDWSGSDAIFTGGKAMFHITSTADLVNITNAVGTLFELNVGLLPIADETDRNGTVIGGGSLWVCKNSDEKVLRGARDFALYLTNTKNMAEWHKLTGYYPVRKSSVDLLKKEGWFDSDARQLVAFNQLLNTKVNEASAGGLAGSVYDNRTIIEEALQKILNGTSPESAMTEAKKLSDAKLAEYNANVQ